MTHYIIANTMAGARKAEADYREKNPDAEVRLLSDRNGARAVEGARIFPGDTFVEIADVEGEDPGFRHVWDVLLRSAVKSSVKIRRRQGRWQAIPTADHPIFKVDPLLDDVRNERVAQLRKWGVQHHEFRRPFTSIEYTAREQHYKTEFESQRGAPTWDVILLEEVYEALAEDDPKKRVEELIQVAAVALAIAEDIQSGD